MKKQLTKHAQARMQQRGFSSISLDIIQEFGRAEHAPGNATKLFFGNREYSSAVSEFKKVIQLLDKVKGGTLIISDDDNIITAYKQAA